MRLEMRSVGFTYMPGTPVSQKALEDVNLAINQGEFLGIIGPTGSGKSTLIQHLNGLLLPSEGQVLVDGKDISGRDFDLRSLRRRVGLLFQFAEQQLFEETVFADVAFGPRNMGLEERMEDRVCWAMAAVGLDYLIFKDRSPFSLSGGEMRRVALAGVLAMEPEILVLDEPLTGLDTPGKQAIVNQLQKLQKERGLTVVLVTHDIDTLAALADRIVVLFEGHILLNDSPERVFLGEELLRSIGLEIPQITRIVARLRECGWQLPPFIAGAEEAAEAIFDFWEL